MSGGLVEIGALWKPDRESKAVLSGRLGNARLLILKNNYKESDKHPDYRVFVAAPEKRTEKRTEHKPQGDAFGEDDLPF